MSDKAKDPAKEAIRKALALAWNQGHLAASMHGDLDRPGNQNPYEETPWTARVTP